MSAATLPRPASRATPRASILVLQALAAVLVLACAATGLFIAQAYPIRPLVAAILFGAWFVFAALRPSWSLVGSLALLPVLAFAPRTGWLIVEEFDLVVLATAGGGYAGWIIRSFTPRLHPSAGAGDRARVSALSLGLVALFLASLAISLARGLTGGADVPPDWFQQYDGPLNALRIFKSFVWAVLLLPLIVAEARRPQGVDRLQLGLFAALALATFAVVRERYLFAGLLDFSSDYRVTGSFWEMHVGGAALEPFLVLTIPFAIREAVRRGHPVRFALAILVLGMTAYTCLVSFSRGVYAATPATIVALIAFLYWQRPRALRRTSWPALAKGACLAAAVAVAGFVVFRSGGYRATLAVILLFAATLRIDSTPLLDRPATLLRGVVLGLLVAVPCAWLASIAWKGPYIACACAALLFAAASWRSHVRPSRNAAALVVACHVWLAIAACHVAAHWGGASAAKDCALVALVLVGVAAWSSVRTKPLWSADPRRQIATMGIVAVVTAAVVVLVGGAYMSGRVANSKGDMQTRLTHWREAIARLHGTTDLLFGEGLGRYPATSFFEARPEEAPGGLRLLRRDGTTFLRLTAPRTKYLGWGEMFRFSQRVEVLPEQRYLLRVEARSAAQTALSVELCQKLLLYESACNVNRIPISGQGDEWEVRDVELDTKNFPRDAWLYERAVFFSIAVAQPSASVEIRRIRMIGPGGVDVLANGDFADRTARWFTSSYMLHLPYHVENLWVGLVFDQGVVGLVLFVLLVGAALTRLVPGSARLHPDAPYLAASIVGFLVIGTSDSLLDVPRVAFLFYFVVMVALVVRSPGVRKAVPVRVEEPRAPAPVSTTPASETSERAARRRRAFGDRGPR